MGWIGTLKSRLKRGLQLLESVCERLIVRFLRAPETSHLASKIPLDQPISLTVKRLRAIEPWRYLILDDRVESLNGLGRQISIVDRRMNPLNIGRQLRVRPQSELRDQALIFGTDPITGISDGFSPLNVIGKLGANRRERVLYGYAVEITIALLTSGGDPVAYERARG